MSAHVRQFYDRHPITAAQILAKVKDTRGSLDKLKAEDLFAYDQDHYGGLAANDALAEAAGIKLGHLVLDICCGLGGPARHLASRRRAKAIGVDLSESRVRGAVDLTRRVGFQDRVRFVRADAQRLPFPADHFDAALSQEALLHVPDKGAAIREAFRVLKPGARMAFTDWIATPELTDADRDLLWTGIAGQTLQSVNQYLALLREAGFAEMRITNLSALWAPVLRERLDMYRTLRADALKAEGRDVHADYVRFYESFVALVEKFALGGARFVATKPAR
jgi:SAM-dependent methyltransferase